ncbi:unnamed protein product [Anisakis simplex]|uniref:Uncharacterized protein n=1 Tax=Anisakis simplex TaxID=6269 RepID=A0A0M3J3D2_ANISI|nr:unnamed protein product [Anisakis simplex]
MAERLKAKEEQAINMGNRLKLVEEASSLRVRELKLQLKLVAEKLERKTAECRKLRSELSVNKSNSQLVSRESTQQHRSHVMKSPSESQSPTSATSTSSFDQLQEVENCRGAGPSAVGNQRGKVMERRALQANALRASSNSVHLESSSNASVQPLMTSTPMQSFVEVEENGENVEHASVLSPIKLPLTRKVLSNGDGVNNNNNENRVTTTSFNDLLLKRNQQQQEQQRNMAENILKVTSGQDDVKMKDVAETNAKAGTSAENHSDEIDPVMQQYMNIVLKKREEEKKTKEQREVGYIVLREYFSVDFIASMGEIFQKIKPTVP